jgi:hypothetical protein
MSLTLTPFPLSQLGRGGLRGRGFECENLLQNVLHVAYDFFIPNSQDVHVVGFEILEAILVVLHLVTYLVYTPFKLDDEAKFSAIEVNNITTDMMLSAELQSVEPMVAQLFPQQLFRGS